MSFATWCAIAIAGPGALFVLAWFLRDAARMRRRAAAQARRSSETIADTSSERNGDA